MTSSRQHSHTQRQVQESANRTGLSSCLGGLLAVGLVTVPNLLSWVFCVL